MSVDLKFRQELFTGTMNMFVLILFFLKIRHLEFTTMTFRALYVGLKCLNTFTIWEQNTPETNVIFFQIQVPSGENEERLT